MKTTSKIMTTSKNVSSPLIHIKVANGSLALQIETIPGRVASVRVGLGRSNSDYKAISASQQSWSLGLAELGKNW